jgi:hypothetical protein
MDEWTVWWSCNAALGHKANVPCGAVRYPYENCLSTLNIKYLIT